MTALHLIAAYLLGAISFGVFVLVVLVKLHKRPAPPPTLANRRKNRDARTKEVAPWNKGEAEPSEPGVRYEWINIAGESE